jgi:hypothetical protein
MEFGSLIRTCFRRKEWRLGQPVRRFALFRLLRM